MHELDDIPRIRKIDRSNMLEKIDRMPAYLTEAMADFKESPLPQKLPEAENVLLVGMGTSAIAGEVAVNWLAEHLKIPAMVIRDGRLPSFADATTLTVVTSHSGDTQEALEALVDAHHRRCQVVTISSGGKMKQVSEKLRIPHVEVRGGFEPRTAFPFLFVSSSLSIARLVPQKDFGGEIEEASLDLEKLRSTIGWNVPYDRNPAKQLADEIKDTFPVVYCFQRNGGLARRMKNQLNENSKMPALFNLFPEACHNEFESWRRLRQDEPEFSFTFLRLDETEDEKARVEEAKKVLTEAGMTKIYEVNGAGRTRASQLLSIIYFTDHVTFYIAVLRNIDPTPWERIQELKKRVLRSTRFEERLDEALKKNRG